MRPASELVAYANNSRTHSPEQIEQLKASFRQFGVNTPLGVDADGILVGHGRLQAMNEMWAAGDDVPGPGKRDMLPRGMVPTIDLSGLSEEERKAYIIADNQLALNAGWDFDMLRTELVTLGDAGFDLGVLGFDPDSLADMLATPNDGLTDPDDAPPLEEVAISRPGDMWLLGAHRLLCGSSVVATDVERVLGDDKPNLMVTDPPYGVNYDPAWRNETGKDADGKTVRKSSGKVVSANSTRATGKVANDDQADWREAWALFGGNVAYVWHAGLHASEVAQSLTACKLLPRAQIVWVKTRMTLGRGNYQWQHEPAAFAVREGVRLEVEPEEAFEQDHGTAAYAVRKGKPGRWRGGRKQTTVWFIEHLKNDTGHGTQKPVECMKRPIENNSAPGESVYEPFSGSGTTIIAGEMCERYVFAIELDPRYIDVAVKRWQAFTGKEATLDGDGRTWAQLVAEREAQAGFYNAVGQVAVASGAA
jgi:DNA modification methylase